MSLSAASRLVRSSTALMDDWPVPYRLSNRYLQRASFAAMHGTLSVPSASIARRYRTPEVVSSEAPMRSSSTSGCVVCARRITSARSSITTSGRRASTSLKYVSSSSRDEPDLPNTSTPRAASPAATSSCTITPWNATLTSAPASARMAARYAVFGSIGRMTAMRRPATVPSSRSLSRTRLSTGIHSETQRILRSPASASDGSAIIVTASLRASRASCARSRGRGRRGRC